MDKIVFLLKTYARDIMYAQRLIESYEKYNVDQIPLYIVVDREDLDVFNNGFTKRKNITVLCKDVINVEFADEYNNGTGITDGYINQEIVKLAFWELGLAENYFCLDSDAVFVRNFGTGDFIASDGYPYTVLYDDNRLVIDGEYYSIFWESRTSALEKIKSKYMIEDRMSTCHGFQIMNREALSHLKTYFMEVNGYQYLDLCKISPYEFSWYTYYVQKENVIPLHVIGELFLTFHLQDDYAWSCIRGISEDAIRRGYLGYVLNSNYTKGKCISWGELGGIRIRIIKHKMYLLFQMIRGFIK